VSDRDDGRRGKPRFQQSIKRRLRRLVERRGGFVEKQIIRRLQEGARNAESLLLAERQDPVPMRLVGEPLGQAAKADRRDHLGERLGGKRAGLGGISDCRGERGDGKIGTLR